MVEHQNQRGGGVTRKTTEAAAIVKELASGILAFPGPLGEPRLLEIEGEADFEGYIAYGYANDLAPGAMNAKHVVLVGHGAFAIENARNALEDQAHSVVMVCRRQHIVVPRLNCFVFNSMHSRQIQGCCVH